METEYYQESPAVSSIFLRNGIAAFLYDKTKIVVMFSDS